MINGKKVRFRPVEETDVPLLAKWYNDPHIAELVVGWSFPVSTGEQAEWLRNSWKDKLTKRWMVETLEGQTIGLTGLWDINWQARHALTALKIGESALQGKGHGSDAIMLMMAYAFSEVGLDRLWGEIVNYNVPSYKAYVERCGWRVEGILRRHAFRAGGFHDVLRVGILKEEFWALPRASEYVQRVEARIRISADQLISTLGGTTNTDSAGITQP